MKVVPISLFNYDRETHTLYIDMAELETWLTPTKGGFTFTVKGKTDTVEYLTSGREMTSDGEIALFIFSPVARANSTGRSLPLVHAFND